MITITSIIIFILCLLIGITIIFVALGTLNENEEFIITKKYKINIGIKNPKVRLIVWIIWSIAIFIQGILILYKKW